MRKWHRWLVIFAGVFLVWIAATGLIGQVISLTRTEHRDAPAANAQAGSAATAPMAENDPPKARKPRKNGDLYHFIIDLHSGEYFGVVGKVLSALLGAVMLFFSLSGMWMYIDMFRKRKRIGRTGLFWK